MENHIPSLLPCLQSTGLNDFLDKAFAKYVRDNRKEIHKIVDAILSQEKQTGGKGHKAMKATGAAVAGAEYTQFAPVVDPASTKLRHDNTTSLVTRSVIEPIGERRDSSTTVQKAFDFAAAECRTAVKSIIAQCRKNKLRFFDPSFYFDSRETMYPEGSPSDCTVAKPTLAARLSEVFPNAPLFANSISFDDLTQGQVGDCYLIGAISSLAAASPEELQNLFVAYDVECGVYGVVFFKSGGWEWVIVDDFIAVNKERSGQIFPLFASCGEQAELWPMVLEKAYAKLHYNWDTIDGGWAKEALVDMTGGLGYSLDLHDKNEALTFKEFKIKVTDPLNVLGCAVGDHVEGSGGPAGHAGEEGAVFGLFRGHQYSVIDAVETSDGNGFVRVRNPWGNDAEWKGPYGDNTEEWIKYPKHRQELHPEFKDDGAFWMKWEDFRNYMSNVDVVRCFPDDWKVLTMFGCGEKLATPSNTYVLQVCDRATKLTVCFAQDDNKVKYNSGEHVLQRKPCNVLLLQMCGMKYEGEFPTDFEALQRCLMKPHSIDPQRERDVFFEGDFEPGVYCITPSMDPADGTGMYLRVFGPPDADYALWRFSYGEQTRQVVGNCPPLCGAPAPQGQKAPAAATPPATAKSPAAQQPLGKEAALARELEESQGYARELAKRLEEQQRLIEQLQKSAGAGKPKTKTPLDRLGLSQPRWRELVDQVFSEVTRGAAKLSRPNALNAARLLVTLGAGMDDCFLTLLEQRSTADGVSLEEFRTLCDEFVRTWPVLGN